MGAIDTSKGKEVHTQTYSIFNRILWHLQSRGFMIQG